MYPLINFQFDAKHILEFQLDRFGLDVHGSRVLSYSMIYTAYILYSQVTVQQEFF